MSLPEFHCGGQTLAGLARREVKQMAYNSLMVFTGNANPKLAAAVALELNIELGRANVGRFSDGEVSVEIDEHVRGKDIFVEAQDENLYASIDALADKLDRQVLKYKSKAADHGHDSLKNHVAES